MNSTDRSHADKLREALLVLDPSGPDGFEGLVAIALAAVMGQAFRLASSGTQQGRDGDSAFDRGETYFEAKRYREKPSKNIISDKLFDLQKNDNGQTDLFILGATYEADSVWLNDVHASFDKIGIGFVPLDWSNTDFGNLLIAIVASGDAAKDFIDRNLNWKKKGALAVGARAAIDHFEAIPNFDARVTALQSKVCGYEVGLGHAKTLNFRWLEKILGSRIEARASFGQPLAPLEGSRFVFPERQCELRLRSAFSGPPSKKVFAVVGHEGVGKSWAVAKAWLACQTRSILLFCTADQLQEVRPERFENFLVHEVIRQTEGQENERTRVRWQRRFSGWKAISTAQNARVTLVIDGLNQTTHPDWATLIDKAALYLSELGGSLIITTRLEPWRQLKSQLAVGVVETEVVDWSPAELNGILSSIKITTKLNQKVFDALRNPRIFGIATDLLATDSIGEFNELSKSRLMFEHLRKAKSSGAVKLGEDEFVTLLRDLAADVLGRVEKQESDDLRKVVLGGSGDLNSVLSCRFFARLPGVVPNYEIRQDGLNLGLALFLLDDLEKEIRARRDPDDRLAELLDPISALDETAKIVFLAAEVACLDDRVSEKVRVAVLSRFVFLQNLPNDDIDAFVSLIKNAPGAFTAAAEKAYLGKDHVQNERWLRLALLTYRDETGVWEAVSTAVKKWLSLYSFAPERFMFHKLGGDNETEVSEERARRQEQISARRAGLTKDEISYIERLLTKSDQWDFDRLQGVALQLLSGKALAEYAPHLISWQLSNNLNSGIYSPTEDFSHLIRFNPKDWDETREALLTGIEPFGGDRSSDVGKWTQVAVMRAIGTVKEVSLSNDLAEWLVRNRNLDREGSSLREKYCANDPCDPKSTKPENVDETARQYRDIEPSTLATERGGGSLSRVFNMARAGVVRFHADDAVLTHRNLADHVMTRSGVDRWHGIQSLLPHSAALTTEQAEHFLAAGQSDTATNDHELYQDRWISAQYSILLSLPHLPADRQLETIAAIKGGPIILSILDCVVPASPHAIETVLENLERDASPNAQAAVLGAIQYSRPFLTPGSLAFLVKLLKSEHSPVRAQVLGIAAAYGESSLLAALRDDGWDVRKLDVEKDYESWYGSSAVLAASKAGIIPVKDALDRISPGFYGSAAEQLSDVEPDVVAPRVDAALFHALAFTPTRRLPEIAKTVSRPGDRQAPTVSLNEPEVDDESLTRARIIAESDEEFRERQMRVNEAFKEFAKDLSSADARLILSDISLESIEAIIRGNPEYGTKWLDLLSDASESQLALLHNFAMPLALSALSEPGDRAAALLKRLLNIHPSIQFVEGISRLSSTILDLWKKASFPACREICRQRLINADTDAKIAVEVLAASLASRTDLIEEVIDSLMAKGRMVDHVGRSPSPVFVTIRGMRVKPSTDLAAASASWAQAGKPRKTHLSGMVGHALGTAICAQFTLP